jgi:hypothetical protein
MNKVGFDVKLQMQLAVTQRIAADEDKRFFDELSSRCKPGALCVFDADPQEKKHEIHQAYPRR